MIRCSQAYRICTNRPDFNEDNFNAEVAKLSSAMAKKQLIFNIKNIDDYCTTDGIKTQAKKVKGLIEKKYQAEHDPLSEGAMTYIEEIWLQDNCNLYDFSVTDDMPQIKKGNLSEDGAINIVGQAYDIKIEKNEESKQKGFLKGTCDVTYANVIRDTKVPETWKGYRKASGIISQYYWQLIAYCHLYDCNVPYLDYVLMPYPNEMIPNLTKYFSEEEQERFFLTQEAIKNLEPGRRVKTFKIQKDIAEEIEFLESRLDKAETYYNSLTYEKCMKLLVA